MGLSFAATLYGITIRRLIDCKLSSHRGKRMAFLSRASKSTDGHQSSYTLYRRDSDCTALHADMNMLASRPND